MHKHALLLLAASLMAAGCERQNTLALNDPPPAIPVLGAAASAGPPTLAPMLAQVSPAVVNISVEGTIKQEPNPAFKDPTLRRFFNLPDAPQAEQFNAVGSGVIIDATNGYVLTNNHVVENADRVMVTLKDGRQLEAKVAGTDPQTDIAVLKISPSRLTALPLGDSKKVLVGDYVVAIGNPFGLGQTATFGIVSAVGRSGLGIEGYEDFIQTDASINPGNSGGALVNFRGELIGINSAIFSRTGSNVGVGFAVPANMARWVAQQLVASGKVTRGSLGVTVQDLTPPLAQAMGTDRTGGAVVAQVAPRSPAAKAGLQRGDIITALDADPVNSSSQLRNAIAERTPGTNVRVTLLRDGQEQNVTASLGTLPPPRTALARPQPQHEVPDDQPLFGITPGSMPGRGVAPNDGVYITKVTAGSVAAHAGLEKGDVIIFADRTPVNNPSDLQRILRAHKSDKPALLQIMREGTVMFLALG